MVNMHTSFYLTCLFFYIINNYDLKRSMFAKIIECFLQQESFK
ncbi:hypothetical protein ASZ90_006177 [hydrocarbon metagenome]|uniref:Uncharacterized protein n=1 Tax=hydrocarbon metagenome TaxID=938273 RepID=A0A0W8FSZ9_9ZZZZ